MGSIGEQEGVAAIEEILRNLAFCSLDEEFGKELVGGSSLALRIFRVCRISQLAIQYLLHEKDLAKIKEEMINQNEEDLRNTLRKVSQDNMENSLKINKLNENLKIGKEIIEVQQDCLFNKSDFKEFQKCCFCEKIFVNQSFP